MRSLPAKDKISLINRARAGENVAKLCREANISRKTFYWWLKKYNSTKPNLALYKLADRRFKKNFVSKSVHYKDKLLLINKALAKEDSVAEICRKFNVSRKSFYAWLRRYQKTGEEGLYHRRPKGETHYRFLPKETEELILYTVSQHPEFSVHRLAKTLNFGHHGIQNLLERRGINTIERRKIFAQGYITTPKTKVSPLYLPEIPIYRLRQLIAPFTTIPKLIKENPQKGIVVLLASFVPLLIFYFFIKLLIFAPAGQSRIGLIFATVSLNFGIIFFLYSLKYYMSIVMVLKMANSGVAGTQKPKVTNKFSRIIGWGRNQKRAINPLLLNFEKITLSKKPFVSIHVALYNEKNVIERLISAVTSQVWENYEVIICDDSNDETTEIAKQFLREKYGELRVSKDDQGTEIYRATAIPNLPSFTLIHRASRSGFKGGALQNALEKTDPSAEYVVVFDADFVPYPDTIEQFIKAFQEIGGGLDRVKESNIAAVQGYQWHVLNKSQTWITRGVRTEYAGSYVIERSGEEIYGGLKQIAGSVYAIRADILRRFGWGKSITEDFELTLRLYEAGYKVAFTPYIQAPAEAVSTVKRLIRQRMRWAEGASFNVKVMLARILKSKNLTGAEKFEFLYLAPYYLQAAFFVVGTLSWFLSEAVLHSHLPFWTAAFGWSLVFTNLLSLPLMNVVGLFLEESDERDYFGVLSFIALSYIVVPFAAYAAVKGFLESAEGPWFRTPKTGLITDVFERSGFAKFFGNVFGRPAAALTTNQQLAASNPLPSLTFASATFDVASAYNTSARLSVYGNLAGNLRIRPKRLRLVGRSVVVALLLFAISLNIVSFNQNGFFEKVGQAYVGDDQKVEIVGKDVFKAGEKPQFNLKIPKDKETRLSSVIRKALTFGETQAAAPTVNASLVNAKGEVKDVSSNLTSDNDNFKLALSASDNFKPGKYTLKVQVKDADGNYAGRAEQDFRWGVLAINTNKSIYTPGEVAKLAFGVLDDEGNTICNAKLELTISPKAGPASGWNFSTDDGGISRSEKCDGNKYSPVPDYTAQFATGFPGIYQMKLTAHIEAGTRQIEDSFEVRDFVPFDIGRASFPTRIKPSYTYPAKLTIVANEDFAGIVEELVPSSFEITNPNHQISNNFQVKEIENCSNENSLKIKNCKLKIITWDVDWRKGEAHELSYTVKFPLESPQFYLVGPLTLCHPERSEGSRDSSAAPQNDRVCDGSPIFAETRSWQIAADPVATVFMETPDATNYTTGDTGTEFWTTVTGSVTYDTTQTKSGRGSWQVIGASKYLSKNNILNDAGRRITLYVRFDTLPNSDTAFFEIDNGSSAVRVRIRATGVLHLWDSTGAFQIGSNGSTLSAGVWYRISLSYTITSTTVNEFRLFLNGTLDISVSNATINLTGTVGLKAGLITGDGTVVFNFHHVYVDDSAALTDTGDIRITAKLPNAVVHDNFDTASDVANVNDRPIDTTTPDRHNASTQVHQDYDIQTAADGDVNISGNTLVAFDYWVWAADGSGPNGTPKIVTRADTETAVSLASAYSLFNVLEDSATYPSAGASVIGMESTGANADTLFGEAGVLVASLGDPVPEAALLLVPLSFAVPKIIKAIQKGTLVRDLRSVLRRLFEAIKRIFSKSQARGSQSESKNRIVKRERKRRRKKKKDG